jgi:hypothetical protein
MTENEKSELAWANNAVLREIAEQLKRIADAFNTPNVYGEVGSEAIANTMARGLQR